MFTVLCHRTFCLIKAAWPKICKRSFCVILLYLLLPYGGTISIIQKEKAGKEQAEEFPRGPSLPPSPKLQQEGPIFSGDTGVPGGQSYV